MIAKIYLGKSFSMLVNYAFSAAEKGEGEPLGGRLGSDIKERIIALFERIAEARPDRPKPQVHFVLSLPPGERLEKAEWQKIVADFTREFGLTENHPYYAVLHKNTDNQHVHIIASRTGIDGNYISFPFSYDTAKRVAYQMELKYGLEQTPKTRPDLAVDADRQVKLNLTRQDIRWKEKHGVAHPKERISNAIEKTLQLAPKTINSFQQILLNFDVTATPKIIDGVVKGFKFAVTVFEKVYEYAGKTISSLYRWSELAPRLPGIANNQLQRNYLKNEAGKDKIRVQWWRDDSVKSDVKEVHSRFGVYRIKLTNGQTIEDSATHLRVTGTPDKKTLSALAFAAKKRQWTSVKPLGAEAFKHGVKSELKRKGLEVQELGQSEHELG